MKKRVNYTCMNATPEIINDTYAQMNTTLATVDDKHGSNRCFMFM